MKVRLFIGRDLGTTQLSGQKILAAVFVMKTNQVMRPFSTSTEQYASKED